MEASNGGRDQSMGELVKQLADQTSTLVRQEMELAKAELREKGRLAGMGAGAFGGAGLLGLFALGALTAAAILALATAVDGWLAALIVAAVYGAVAGVLALVGRTKVQAATPPIPEQTTESVKEDVEWTRTRAAQGRR
jgi:MFS family permease